MRFVCPVPKKHLSSIGEVNLSYARLVPLVGLGVILGTSPVKAQKIASPDTKISTSRKNNVEVRPATPLLKEDEQSPFAPSTAMKRGAVAKDTESDHPSFPTKIRNYLLQLWDENTVDLVLFFFTVGAAGASYVLGHRSWKKQEFKHSCTAYMYYLSPEADGSKALRQFAISDGTIKHFWKESTKAADIILTAENSATYAFPFLAFKTNEIFKTLRNELSEINGASTIRAVGLSDETKPIERKLYTAMTYGDIGRRKLRVINLWEHQVRSMLDDPNSWLDGVKNGDSNARETLLNLVKFAAILGIKEPSITEDVGGRLSDERLKVAQALTRVITEKDEAKAFQYFEKLCAAHKVGTIDEFSEGSSLITNSLLTDKNGVELKFYRVVDHIFPRGTQISSTSNV